MGGNKCSTAGPQMEGEMCHFNHLKMANPLLMSWVCWLSKQQNSGDSGVYLQLKLLAGADI